ncbi:unnamed protein product [Ixodes persulcatus]
MQSRRMDEQRTSLPQLPGLRRSNHNNNSLHHRMSVGSVPEDEFFDMIVRCQAGRIEDQRSQFQPPEAPPRRRRLFLLLRGSCARQKQPQGQHQVRAQR